MYYCTELIQIDNAVCVYTHEAQLFPWYLQEHYSFPCTCTKIFPDANGTHVTKWTYHSHNISSTFFLLFTHHLVSHCHAYAYHC